MCPDNRPSRAHVSRILGQSHVGAGWVPHSQCGGWLTMVLKSDSTAASCISDLTLTVKVIGRLPSITWLRPLATLHN